MSGCPQLRLRDSRITCQVSPLIGIALRACDAALDIGADHPRRHRRRQQLAGEQFLGADFRDPWDWPAAAAAWGRRCPVLRRRCGGADDGGGDQEEEKGAEVHRFTLSAELARISPSGARRANRNRLICRARRLRERPLPGGFDLCSARRGAVRAGRRNGPRIRRIEIPPGRYQAAEFALALICGSENGSRWEVGVKSRIADGRAEKFNRSITLSID